MNAGVWVSLPGPGFRCRLAKDCPLVGEAGGAPG